MTLRPMPPRPKTMAFGADLDLGGVDHGADAGGDAAADVADLVEGRVLADLGDRDLGQHGEVREGRAAHVVVDRLALEREARGAVGHQALALRGADRGAEIGLARQAGRALPALRRIERDDVVAWLHRGDARADLDDDAGALVAEDRREEALGIGARQRELVGVADAGRLDLDQHLEGLRSLELHRLDLQRLAGLEGHSGAHVHHRSPRVVVAGPDACHSRCRRARDHVGAGRRRAAQWVMMRSVSSLSEVSALATLLTLWPWAMTTKRSQTRKAW